MKKTTLVAKNKFCVVMVAMQLFIMYFALADQPKEIQKIKSEIYFERIVTNSNTVLVNYCDVVLDGGSIMFNLRIDNQYDADIMLGIKKYDRDNRRSIFFIKENVGYPKHEPVSLRPEILRSLAVKLKKYIIEESNANTTNRYNASLLYNIIINDTIHVEQLDFWPNPPDVTSLFESNNRERVPNSMPSKSLISPKGWVQNFSSI